jgi:hypothetical protein
MTALQWFVLGAAAAIALLSVIVSSKLKAAGR